MGPRAGLDSEDKKSVVLAGRRTPGLLASGQATIASNSRDSWS